MTTCALSGSLVDLGQDPLADVLFRFGRADFTAQEDLLVSPAWVGVRTDSNGAFTINLMAGDYTGQARLPGRTTAFTFSIQESDVTLNLSDAIQANSVTITPNVVLQAQAAADEAEAWAATAGQAYGLREFTTVAAFQADTVMTYTTGQAGTVTAGMEVWAGGFRYLVAASGATDSHIQNVNGVKLYVQKVEGNYPLSASGADATGIADASAKLAMLWELGPVLIDGSFLITSSISQTASHDLVFAPGSQISVNASRTLTVRGGIRAGDAPIFYGAGTVNMNEGPRFFNVGWFDGADLSAKWDFCRRGFLDLYWYKILVPMPSVQDRAADYVTSGGQRRYHWKLAAPLLFSDPENRSVIEIRGQVQATATMANMMVFSDGALKTEDIEFVDRVELLGNNIVTNAGVLYRGAARVNFNHLNVNQCPWAVDFTSPLPMNYIDIRYLYCGLMTLGAVRFTKGTQGVSEVNIGALHGASFSGATLCMVEVNGACRDLKIGSVTYLSGTGNDLQHEVRLLADATGRPQFVDIGQTYAFNADICVYARKPIGASRLEGINIGPIITDITTGGVAVDVEWITNSKFIVANGLDTVTLGNESLRVAIEGTPASVNISGSVAYCIINGTLSQPLAANALPDPLYVMLNETCYDSSERGNAWLRVSNTGVAATDFVPVGGVIRGTGSPESVITAIVGTMFLRMNGGASTTLYIKESGTGNTGWMAK